jgi:DNA topoisomerase IA
VVEREREIETFTPETFFTLKAQIAVDGTQFEAHLHRLKDADVRFTARQPAEKAVGLLSRARKVRRCVWRRCSWMKRRRARQRVSAKPD